MSLLAVQELCSGYGDIQILKGVDISIEPGSITAIIGSNGAGKTTLMRTLSGLLPAMSGHILFEGTEITAEPPHDRLVRGISLVPEGRLVFPDFTVHETLRIGAFSRRASHEWRRRREEMYELFPRLKARQFAYAGSLSGGEQQMLALARGLMSRPSLLLLDEPSLGLSPIMAAEVFDRLTTIRDHGVTICIVEQNVHAALSLADQAYVLEDGHKVKEGPAASLMAAESIRESYLGL